MRRPVFFKSIALSAVALAVSACGGGSSDTTASIAPTTPTTTTPAVVPAPVVVATTPAVVPAPVVVATPPAVVPAPVVVATPPAVVPAPVVVATPPAVVPAPVPSTDTTVTGAAVKGPVNGGTVTLKKPDGSSCGLTATNAAGQYSLTTACKGDIIVEISGGAYLDEATNTTKSLDTPLRVMLTAAGGNVVGVATPLTTMAFSYAFTSSNAATKAAFDAQAAKIATQFGLTGVNLSTTLPVVVGNSNAYGNALKGVSQYLRDNTSKTLATITTASFTNAADFATFGTAFNAAFNKINGSNTTFAFDGTAFNISGTGAGGGSGTCGINLNGTVTAAGFSIPLNLDYCVAGIQAGSCTAGNASLNQSLAGQGGISGAANLVYTYATTCAAGAIAIVLK